MIDRDRMVRAVALSLANDGYIDIDRSDGESYIYGDHRTQQGDIEAVAESIAKWYEADQDAAWAEVLTRRAREGRD